jgi:xanthine dehydrogenase accessory factor
MASSETSTRVRTTTLSDGERKLNRRTIPAEIVAQQQVGRRCVLALALWSLGSAPVAQSAKLLVYDDGTFTGTVGGGALEAEVLRVGREMLSGGGARVLEFDLGPSDAASLGMICGGRCGFLVESIEPGDSSEVFAAAELAESMGEPAAVVRAFRGPGAGEGAPVQVARMAVAADGTVVGTTGDAGLDESLVREATEALAQERSRAVGEPVTAHVDVLLPRPQVFIFGAGHIAVPLAHIAQLVGFQVAVIDDRAEFASRERFPAVDEVLVSDVDRAFADLPIGPESYIVAVTRGHLMDEEVVAAALRAQARYVGMIGSRRKVAQVRQRLRERGFGADDVARIHAPVGVEIHADTIEEIAVSIAAELIGERRGSK